MWMGAEDIARYGQNAKSLEDLNSCTSASAFEKILI